MTIARRSLFVAAMMRALTFTLSLPPTRSNSISCKTRKSFACRFTDISLISSRNTEPNRASSNLPSFRATAPVKDPFSWPNNSDSKSVSTMAEQFTAINGSFGEVLL